MKMQFGKTDIEHRKAYDSLSIATADSCMRTEYRKTKLTAYRELKSRKSCQTKLLCQNHRCADRTTNVESQVDLLKQTGKHLP